MKNKFKITLNAPVTLIFVFICAGATLLNYITRGASNRVLFMTYRGSLLNPLTYVRLLTHVFGHEGFEHFIGNGAYLLLLGPMLEEKYGARTMAEVIALTAVVTGLINFILFPATGLCGASGVVFAFILMTSFTGFSKGEIPLSFILVAAIFIGQQVYEGIFLRDSVSNLSHIVGGLVGSAAGYLLNRK